MAHDIKTLLHKKISDLTGISEYSLEKLFGAATRKEIPKGKSILRMGQVCDAILFIEKGYLRMFVAKDSIEINIAFAFENDFATNLKSLRLSIPSDITIQAEEDLIIYEFNKNDLLAMYKESPEIESFGRILLEHLLIAQEDHSNLFKIFSPKERYDYLLINRPEIIQRVSLSHIASYIGIARETLSRIRKIK
jgi:CRP-like cAMP-binding protein